MIKKIREIPVPDGIVEVPEKPYILRDVKQLKVLCDIHFEFHDKKALDVATRHGTTPDTILLLGDLLDFYALSRFKKRPDYPTIRDEIKMCGSYLEWLREIYPKSRIYYYEGNHEKRLDRYVCDYAPALYDEEFTSLPLRLKLANLGITYIPNGHFMKVGHLYFLHGNEFNSRGGVNIARTMLNKTLGNTLFGNFHKTDQSIIKNIKGEYIANWSVGCLTKMKPEYAMGNNWNWGFADIEFFKDEFLVNNRMIMPNYEVR